MDDCISAFILSTLFLLKKKFCCKRHTAFIHLGNISKSHNFSSTTKDIPAVFSTIVVAEGIKVVLKDGGNTVGAVVGHKVSSVVGESVGADVGKNVGAEVGDNVGAVVGGNVGSLVGGVVGDPQIKQKNEIQK